MSSPAEAQLSFDVIAPETPDEPAPEIDIVDAVIASHNGDPRKAIFELLADADFLRDQLYTASCIISSGFSRGSFKPRYERV